MNLSNHDFDDVPHACYIPFYVIMGERGGEEGEITIQMNFTINNLILYNVFVLWFALCFRRLMYE